MSVLSEDVLSFWMNDVGPTNWISPDKEMIMRMNADFGDLQKQAIKGELGAWVCGHDSCLALVLLLDQFPRLTHRGRAEAYSGDSLALAIAKRAIVMGHDLKVPEALRVFFYLPLMHSESLMDQERCVRLISLRIPGGSPEQLAHAKAHRDIIRQFGRFPHRNPYLGRPSTPAEQQYLDAGGYARMFEAVAA